MILYADVLIFINIFVTYFLLLATQLLCRRTIRRLRLLLASTVGGLYALTVLLDGMPIPVSVLSRICVCVLLQWMVNGYRSLRMFLKNILTFLLVNCLFAGIMFALQLLRPDRLLYQSGVVYMDVNIPFLLLSTLVIFGIIQLIVRLSAGRQEKLPPCRINVTMGERHAACTGMLDTGHRLTDPFTGKPVLIVSERVTASLVPESVHTFLCGDTTAMTDVPREYVGRLRLFAYHAVGVQGVLPAFRCTRLQIVCGKRRYDGRDVYIAVTTSPIACGEYDALLPETIFDAMEEDHHAEHMARSEKQSAAHSSETVRAVGTFCRRVTDAAAAFGKAGRSGSAGASRGR